MARRALITGITGQDGQYLAELLLREGYDVWGMVRGQSNPRRSVVADLLPSVRIVDGDLLDQSSVVAAIASVQPDEVYNLAAISYVALSWQQPGLTGDVTGMGVLRMLEAIRMVSGINGSQSPSRGQIRFYQASSSEMFGKVHQTPQNEATTFHPRSPYGVAKAYGHYITQNYRESYGMYGVSGILFNHESPRRGPEFVTRKISMAAARIKLGLQDTLDLGNLDAQRDWGYAEDYVNAMYLMLHQDEPRDYVIGTGVTHTIRDALGFAFETVGLNWHDHVRQDPDLIRPAEVDLLRADPRLAEEGLGWKATVAFPDLMRMMVESDLDIQQRTRHNTY